MGTEHGQSVSSRHGATHTLLRNYARRLPTNRIPINHLSRSPGHADIKTTLIYPELVPAGADLPGHPARPEFGSHASPW